MGGQGFARAKSECVRVDIHLNVLEARNPEAIWKGARVNHDHGVEQVQEAEGTAVEAV
jgi:hypothetical protein